MAMVCVNHRNEIEEKKNHHGVTGLCFSIARQAAANNVPFGAKWNLPPRCFPHRGITFPALGEMCRAHRVFWSLVAIQKFRGVVQST